MSIVNKLSIIISGWKNDLFKTPEIETIAKKRAEICAGCDHFAVMQVRGAVCDKCLCPIAKKVRAPKERCPEGRWEAEQVNTSNQQ